MKAGDYINSLKKRSAEEKVDLLLFHCDVFYEMEFSNVNVGLLYIATYLEKQNFKVQVMGAYDIYNLSHSQFRHMIRKRDPDVVGFYSISDNYEIFLDVAEKVQKWIPDALIVAGGPLASALEEEMLNYPFIDAVITGEGEYAMEHLCKAVCRGEGEVSETPGIILKQDKKIVRGLENSPIEDLDSLPFPDKKYFQRQQVFQVVSGRGCPYKCTFCFQAGHGLKFRFRSAENVVEEITRQLDTETKIGFDFIDDAFIMNPDRCLKIADELIKYKRRTRRDFIFFCQGRANILDKRPDLIRALSSAGLARIQIGIESGDPKVLKAYNKKITIDQVRRVVDEVRKDEALILVGGFIIGGPFESKKTFKNTLDLAVELIESAPGAFETSAGFLGAYPGTEIAENPKRFGLKMIEEDFSKGFSLTDVQFETEHLNRQQIREMMNEFEMETYRAMSRNLHRIPPKLLSLHYLWGRRFRMYSRWYSLFLERLGAVRDYFKFLESPRFETLGRIPRDQLKEWFPTRSWEKRTYLPDGTLSLPPSVVDITLEDPKKILAYELSCGKLKIGQIAQRLKEKEMPGMDESEILENFLLPFYREMESSYHMVFHR